MTDVKIAANEPESHSDEEMAFYRENKSNFLDLRYRRQLRCCIAWDCDTILFLFLHSAVYWFYQRRASIGSYLGVGIGAVIHNWIPEEFIVKVLGTGNPFGVIIAAICTVGIIIVGYFFNAIQYLLI